MGLFEHWPYVNFHDLNLDWIIKEFPKVYTSRDEAQASAEASAESASASQLSAEASQASAEASQLSAEASQQSAENAAESANDAEETVTSTRQQISLLQSRVDNIIPSGTQTAGNEELLDIRVAYDGEIYDSAGNSVRGQTGKLYDVLVETGLVYYDPEFKNETIAADGTVTESDTRLLSKEFTAALGETFTIAEGFRFRFVHISDDDGSATFTTWFTGSQQFTENMLSYGTTKRIHVSKTDSYEDITPSEVVYETDIKSILIGHPAATENDVQQLQNEIDEKIPSKYNLNKYYTTPKNMMWTQWYYPQVTSLNRIRNQVYWGFCTNDGCTGIASYDIDSQNVVKNILKQTNEIDDHNSPAIYVYDDGLIIVSYSGGHNTDNKIHIRRSSCAESVERFDDEIILESSGSTTYSQFINYNNVLYLFYRVNNNSWAMRSSNDKGMNWTNEKIIIKSTMQYYCKFAPTLTDGTIRMVMYSNPSASDPDIRMGFLNLANGNIYNSDNSTLLGTEEITYTLFNVIIPVETGKTQRLYDVAITEVNRALILFCPFSLNVNTDGVYKIYDAGSIVTVCAAGLALWAPKYQLGCAFIGVDKVMTIRADAAIGGDDIVEIYSYNNGNVTLSEEVARQARGTIRYRLARPIIDTNKKYAVWFDGYYNLSSYTDFNGDAVVYQLSE